MSSNKHTDPEPEYMSNGTGGLQEVQIYNFRDFPNLITDSIAGYGRGFLGNSLNEHQIMTCQINDEEEVPNHRMSVLYQPTFISNASFESLTSPSKLDQSMGGRFCSLKSNEFEPDRIFSAIPPKTKIIYPTLQVPEETEIAEIKFELNSIMSQQNKTLSIVETIREEVSRNTHKHITSENDFNQIQLLKELNDKIVQMHQDMSRLVHNHQQGFDELSRRLSHVEETVSLRRRPSRSKSKPENVVEEPWEKPCFTCIGTFSGHDTSVTCLVSHQNHLMSGSSSGEIRVWDTTVLKCVMHATFTSDPISCMALSQELLFVANEACSIFLVDLSTMKIVSLQEEAHRGGIFAMSIVDNYLFTSSLECIKVWNIEKFQISFEHTISGLSHNVRALHYDSCQNILYSGAHNSVHGWSTTSPFHLGGKFESKKLGTIFSITSIEECLFVGTYNQSIHVVNKNTFQTIKILQSHIGCISALITGPGEACVISGSLDASVVVCY
ncbi:E3 ubiquitin-protein ligase TRAF7-like [Oopsacas minuta]|uniref:E3 ubiquitin-protein ligase TRAF7-like n=1 Tax=Oopsacas minuta TaxID=111878 RepID=A0AAV7K944_9METZ|nr:E3 ubiquitin-protein ligase TRAF7-like [Oopsacas minuta]